MRKPLLYYLLVWTLIIVGLVFLVKLAPILYSPEFILSDDFGHFWASGKLFIEHKNPYNLELLFSTQFESRAASSSSTSIEPQTLNPPWTLLLFSPLSLLDYSLARIIWLLINILFIVLSVRVFWNFTAGPNKNLWLAILIVLCYTPTYSVLSKGQITPWVVLGITGFILYAEGKINVWWAGLSLVILSTKPQLFYLLWPALGLWAITKHKWKVILTGLSIGGFAILVTLLVNNQIFSQYLNAIQKYPYDQWATPTIGAYLRFFWLGIDQFWVQYLPAFLGLGWLIFHYLINQNHWSWIHEIPVLTLVSILTSPYAWTYDAIIILPAILTATDRLSVLSKAIKVFLWLIFILINTANLLLHTQLSDFWFIWFTPLIAIWFLLVSLFYQKRLKVTS